MVFASYQRDSSSVLPKQKSAKILFALILIAIVMMSMGTFLYPHMSWRTTSEASHQDDSAFATPALNPGSNFETEEDVTEGDFGFSGAKTDDICRLPDVLRIFKSEDGTFTPYKPDPSLLMAINNASPEDYEHYCRNVWDPEHGFTDVFPYNEHGECGNWQAKYKELHTRRLEQLDRIRAKDYSDLDSDDKPGFVAYLCKEVPVNGNRGCGGLADRMSGMVSTFMFALLTDRAYFAHWADENPIPLEILFEEPNIKWSYDPSEMKKLFDYPKEVTYQKVETLNKNYDDLGAIMFPDGPQTDFSTLFTGTFIEVRSNRGYIVRTFRESDIYPAVLKKMGLNKVNAFGCMVDFLFRPTIGSRRFLNAFKGLFEMKSILSIGMQIRSNDTALVNPDQDVTTLEQWDHFLTCANQLAEVKREPHHTHVVYFMVTDSVRLRDEFLSLNTNRAKAKKFFGKGYQHTTAVATGLPVDHIEPAQLEKHINATREICTTVECMTPGVNSAVVENWLLGHADYRLISPQGYGKLAAFHSKSDTTTISLPRADKKEKSPDCSNPDAFVTYDFLSTQWSLG